MNIFDKSNVFERLSRGENLAIEIGCGPRKMEPSAIGIDLLDFDCVDIVGDAFEILGRFPNNSVSSIYTSHFLEHLSDLPRITTEMARVLKPGGRITVIVPHFSNPFYYSDPTHRTPFGLYTFAYFCKQKLFSRRVPHYAFDLALEVQSIQLAFKSYPPQYIRHAIKRVLGWLFNSSNFMREFYEENLCWLMPCYEIRYELYKS